MSLLGLLAISGAWGAAAFIATNRPCGHSSFSVGYGQQDGWLGNAVVYPEGFVLLQYFDKNLTEHNGFYAKMSLMRVKYPLTLRSLFPRLGSNRVSTPLTFHLALPLLVFGAMTFHAIGVPILRRRQRRRLGRCLACGYDLTGNTSGVCPECGETA